MTDCAHRIAASRAIRKLNDRSRHDWLAKLAESDSTRCSLLRLAKSALELHAKGIAEDVLPRTEDERSKPLLVALTALRTILRNEGD
jgi:hypothetical protein